MVLLEHDLRATIADVSAALDEVAEDAVPPGARAALQRSRAGLAMMARLLQHGMHALLARPTPAAPQEADLLRLANDLRAQWQGSGARGAVSIQIEPDLPKGLAADPVALERLITNLIRAADASHDVHVRISVTGQDLNVTVASGAGSAPLAGGTSGTQTAMQVARHMAARLGGHLRFADPDQGGVATFRMPVAADAATPETHPGPDLSGYRILLADDPKDDQPITRQLLAAMGASVVLGADQETILKELARQPIDAVIHEAGLPDMDGMALAAGLPPDHPATIFLIDSSNREERSRLRRAGAEAVLVWPLLCPFALGEAIIGAKLRREARQAGALASSSLVTGAPALPDETTLQGLLKMAGPVAGRELLARLLDDLQAVEDHLITAFATLDMDRIRAETHVLISVAGAVGATVLQHGAERLNRAANVQDTAVIKLEMGRALTHLDGLIQIIADKQMPAEAGVAV